LFTRTDQERRTMLNAIGPVWDGNEVWLVTGGGALFAAFPDVYATVFSGFYLPFMVLLVGLIFRAVAIEFRSKQEMKWWRQLWDISFAAGSVSCSFLLGVTIGNFAWGLLLDADHEFAGTFVRLLHPYAILLGVTTVSLFAMHGSIYIAMKTEGELQTKIRGWVRNCMIFFIVCLATSTLATLVFVPHMTEVFRREPGLFVIAILHMLAVANIPREINAGRDFRAFLSSSAAMATMMALYGIGMFPKLVYSRPHPEHSLTIYNAASSSKSLSIMLLFALIGIPVVVGYTASIYWIFRGKVKLDRMSY